MTHDIKLSFEKHILHQWNLISHINRTIYFQIDINKLTIIPLLHNIPVHPGLHS